MILYQISLRFQLLKQERKLKLKKRELSTLREVLARRVMKNSMIMDSRRETQPSLPLLISANKRREQISTNK